MNTKQAISELSQLLNIKRASEHAEDLLQFLSTAEQRAKEETARAEKVRKEVENLEAAKEKLNDVLTGAAAEAQVIVNAAKVKAEKIIEDAVELAKAKKEEAEKMRADALAHLEAMRDNIDALHHKKTHMEEDIKKIEAALNKAREDARKFLGG